MSINRDLTNPQWIVAKGGLFLLLGLLAAGSLFLEQPTLKAGALLVLTIWCFCRCYYFAFYVMHNYVDTNYKYSGLLSLARHFARKRT